MSVEESPKLELQIKVSKILALGFVFSLVGIGGIASLAAFVLGLTARQIIKRSNVEISGIKMAWWCIIAGGLGTIILPLKVISNFQS